MNIVQDKALQEVAMQRIAELKAQGLPPSLVRDIITVFLLLRWVDYLDAEQEAMAVFEDQPFRPLLPTTLQWRRWAQLEQSDEMAERLRALTAWIVADVHTDPWHPLATYMHLLVAPLRRILQANFPSVLDAAWWLGELPFETPSERRSLLPLFDYIVGETSSPADGAFYSPVSVAQLAAALANPRPGERVYDPCFGSGNLLVAAWQQADSNRAGQHRPGTLLEVFGVEINADAFIIGLIRILLAGIDTPRLEVGNSLEREAVNGASRHGFDVVLADPPIGAKLRRETPQYRHFPILTNDSVGLFIQHALSQLKPHGRAVIAVPEGFLFRGGADRELRRSLIARGQIEAVIGLPAGVYAPYTSVKVSLLVLNKQGGASSVRMVDATSRFEPRSGRSAPFIRKDQAQELANEVRRAELRTYGESPIDIPVGAVGDDMSSRSIWEVSPEDLAAAEWDLTPRRREKGALDELLSNLKEALGEACEVTSLSAVAQITAGRAVKPSDLIDRPASERSIGYIRIKDLVQGKVDRCSSWITQSAAESERHGVLRAGDVLLSRSGTIGRAALVRNGAIGSVAANGLYVLRVDLQRLDPGFLLAYLASPACQNWLAAQARGTAIQHLNRVVLEALPIALPTLALQARAAANFREFGTDALSFLLRATRTSDSDRLATWLAELSSKTPNFTEGLDATPALAQFEVLAAMAGTARRWIDQEPIEGLEARWLQPLTEALLQLAGASQIPPGPGLLTVLQIAEHQTQTAREQAAGNFPIESQARATAEKLSNWIRSAIRDLVGSCRIVVSAVSPSRLLADTAAEIIVELVNDGALPIRDFSWRTLPDWGSEQTRPQYIQEGSGLYLLLQGETPKTTGTLTIQLNWSARSLLGNQLDGTTELALQIVQPDESSQSPTNDLGGSPYVTGSPLEPQYGHGVFFGREQVIEHISRQIKTHGNVVLLEGNRRAGKTSILKHIEGSTTIPGWLVVYASLQGAEGDAQSIGVPTSEVFREIARSVATALTYLGLDVPLPNGSVLADGKPALGVARACREGISNESPFADFREYLELVLALLEPLGLGLVLMLDEFDKLQDGIDSGVTSPQVPENIRFLIQTYPKFSAILTGSRRLKRLREEYWSALYGLGENVAVTSLDPESARLVVTEPVRDKLIYSSEAVERVLEMTARQPYLMQCLCNRVFAYAVKTKSHSITLGIVNDVAASLVRDNEHFASLWDYAAMGPERGRLRRQLILLLCARSLKQRTQLDLGTLHELLMQWGADADDDALDEDLAYLRELELVELQGEIGDGHYRLTIPLMADWIEQQQDADVLASRARIEAEQENA